MRTLKWLIAGLIGFLIYKGAFSSSDTRPLLENALIKTASTQEKRDLIRLSAPAMNQITIPPKIRRQVVNPPHSAAAQKKIETALNSTQCLESEEVQLNWISERAHILEKAGWSREAVWRSEEIETDLARQEEDFRAWEEQSSPPLDQVARQIAEISKQNLEIWNQDFSSKDRKDYQEIKDWYRHQWVHCSDQPKT